ncbi:MAG: crossover junction endodeoxyribonuclease RuvC [Lentisphaeria bacterium]|nr:crossover junction endodeoxyribonuclease RuvC [Lentisphaeria bacterium]
MKSASAKSSSPPTGVLGAGSLRILGVDTALRTTGFGIVDACGNTFSPVDCGVVKTTRSQPLSECLRRLAGGMRELAKTYAPDVVAIEGAFYCKNVRTSMVLGSARGAVIATLAEMGIPIYEYAPRRVKQSVCGFGNASKQQVALLVSQILKVAVGNLPDDATDALALAICHAQALATSGGLSVPDPL